MCCARGMKRWGVYGSKLPCFPRIGSIGADWWPGGYVVEDDGVGGVHSVSAQWGGVGVQV